MPNFDPDLVDPSVTAEEIELAQDGTPADFPEGETQDDEVLDGEQTARGLMPVIPATPHQAIVNAKTLRTNHTFVGVGMCLATVRGRIFEVPALWPDAETAMEHSAPFHPLTDPLAAPRGSVGFAANHNVGHVWLNLGGGLVSTTDFHENGFEGVALLSRMLTWCGATSWGYGEVLNGFDVWPDPKKPKPPAKPWGLAEREQVVHRALRQARQNHAPQRRIAGLQAWDDKLLARMKHGSIDRLALS